MTLYNPDEFCRTCRGKRGHREPSSHDPRNTVWTPCPDCQGTGWRPGAIVEAMPIHLLVAAAFEAGRASA